ncbi:hypothetical protein [Cupriavidus malaysiensis]|uniref:Uncharacterized protein n=1 Tax=Cupriavidus malaysiensis TaxID=367825 RepID=A0ABN4TI38_9BURK|nr:hypothetical protein [Cupriavidus malaysiensis]AOZ05964.1 hypothetical protein BKK80_09080 [Cupriavidus malaysiensis]
MATIRIAGQEHDLEAAKPLREGSQPVTLQGTRLMMPPPLYTLQLAMIDVQAGYAAGTVSAKEMAEQELGSLVATLRRNYPGLPDAWVAEWDARDIWALRTAYIQAGQPPQEDGSGEPASR